MTGLLTACSRTDAGYSSDASVVLSNDTSAADDAEAPALMSDVRHKDTLTIALTGDILMGTTYPAERLPADDGRRLFDDAAAILAGADIAVGNLEGTLCSADTTKKKLSRVSYAFCTPPAYAGRLADAGYDFVSVANNHAFDFGIKGVISTERALDSVGVRYAGISGRTETAVIVRDGVRYGLCAFGHDGYTLSVNDTVRAAAVIDNLRRNVDILIVSFHGGGEGVAYRHLPDSTEIFLRENRGYLRSFARMCVDHGADIVYGHGPHVVRCVELYKNRFIAYSLGNFCTPYGINVKGVAGLAPIITVRTDAAGAFIDAHIHSLRQTYGIGPRTDTANGAARQIRSLTLADIDDSRLTVGLDGDIKRK